MTFSKSSTLFLVLLLLNLIHQFQCQSNPELEPLIPLSQGKIRGKVSDSREGRKFISFLGIPYTTKPERFKLSPETTPAWDGVRDGTRFGNRCPEYDRTSDVVIGHEDCLFLNVYTPVYSTPNQALLPVMVYIHGGYFVEGSGQDYSPEYFMDQDVIVVTFNYRLGVFGFMTTQNKNLIPNLGMKDQVKALAWVKWNIAKFGGDRNRITIFGSGAGAASVGYHMISPLSQGLFTDAISQSGSALCPWALVRNPYDVTVNYAKRLNCSTANSFSIAACLKGASVSELVRQQHKFLTQQVMNPSFASNLSPFGPVTESILHTRETGPMFISEQPMKSYREGKLLAKVPWLMGVNSADGVTWPVASLLNATSANTLRDLAWDHIAPLVFYYKDTAPAPLNMSQKIHGYYMSGRGLTDEKWRENFTTALSDRNFFRCTRSTALLAAQHSQVWVYYLTYRPQSGRTYTGLGLPGVFHSEEVGLFFRTRSAHIPKSSPDFQLSRALVRSWATFASKSDPDMITRDGQRWEALPQRKLPLGGSAAQLYMCNIDKSNRIISEPFTARLQFWDKLRLMPPQPHYVDHSGDDVISSGATSGYGQSRLIISSAALLVITTFLPYRRSFV